MQKEKKSDRRAGPGKAERYVQPSILMALWEKESYGYELINNIQEFGFIKGQAPPGMIYRHLRQLEEDELVSSNWETQNSGPAKRIYEITQEGREVLSAWVDYMNDQAQALSAFVKRYNNLD